MAHLLAYKGAINSATLVPIEAVPDDIMSIPAPDRVQIPADKNSIHWAAALGTKLIRAQLDTPSLDVKRMTADIVPAAQGAIVFDPAILPIFVPKNDIILTPSENLRVIASATDTGATDVYALIQLKAAGLLPAIPQGDIRIIKCSGATTLVGGKWTTVSVTPDLDLEAGNYTLIGFLPLSATGIASRALFNGQVDRPGMPCIAGAYATSLAFNPMLRDALQYFSMGVFSHITLPQFQFLAAGADTTQDVLMYCIKTA